MGEPRSCRASRPRISAPARSGSSKAGRGLIGQTIGIAGEHPAGSCNESAALSVVWGSRCGMSTMPHADYAQLGFPGAERIWPTCFNTTDDFNAEFARSGRWHCRGELHPGLLSFEPMARHPPRSVASVVDARTYLIHRYHHGHEHPEIGPGIYRINTPVAIGAGWRLSASINT